MRIAGIIAEYDPFHNGHAAHIAATRDQNGGNATHIIAVISGSFTQRGEPALLNKFRRAEMALACGADLVVELPLPWAMAPAESFAYGGVSILNALGCVDLLSFGSECGDISTLRQLSDTTNDPAYTTALKQSLSKGLPYASAVQAAAESIVGKKAAEVLASPNNTLGIEYMRAICRVEAEWDVFTMQRQGVSHNDMNTNGAYASASLLREIVRSGTLHSLNDYIPEEAVSILLDAYQRGETTTQRHRLENALTAQLRRFSKEDYATLPWLSEGLEYRLYRESRSATEYRSLLNALKTRRYPMARLRRVLWAALLGMTDADTKGAPPYIRILGMNARGREILATAAPTLPIVSRAAQFGQLDERSRRVFALECAATDLHALAMDKPLPCGTDHTTKLIVK